MKYKLSLMFFVSIIVTGSIFAQTKLKYKVLYGTPFNNVVQTIIYGEKEAILIDGGLFNSDAHRAAAAVLDLNVKLTTIYITHAHADHFFGLTTLIKEFPDVKIVSLPQIALDIMNQKDSTLKAWEASFHTTHNFPTDVSGINVSGIGTSEGATISLEGNDIKFVGEQRGDVEHASFVWVPTLKMIVSGDIIYNKTYPWTQGTNAVERARWVKSTENIISYNPVFVVPGHGDPSAPITVAAAIFTRDYLKFYDQQLTLHPTKAAFVAAVKKRFPIKMSYFALDLAVSEMYPDVKK